MTNWNKVEAHIANIAALKKELRQLRGEQKVVVKNPVPFILYSRPWESIVIKPKKERENGKA